MSSLTPRLDKIQKNYLINGDMRIAQRGTSFAAIATGAYSLDRMIYNKTGLMVHTITQDTDVPSLAQADYLFQNSLRLNLTTIDASIDPGDFTQIGQSIEGYNWANLAQKSFTLSFWVKATLPGIYCVSFINSGSDRSYVAEYTINTTETWEYKTITVSAPPSAGTWNYSSGVGLRVRWALASGSTFNTSANSWQTGNYFATSNQVNGVANLTTTANFRITGISICEGELDSPKFSTFGKDAGLELNACERYYQVISRALCYTDNTTATAAKFVGQFVPEMRASPTILIAASGITSVNMHINAAGPTAISVAPNANAKGFLPDSFATLGAGSAVASNYIFINAFSADAEL